MSCATEKCDDPTCGPCTIYERFPLLRKLQARPGQVNRTKMPLLSSEENHGTHRSQSRPEPTA